jgi:NAD(P)-dependent dehydrogenase (short-subunit alcohol dehydrogenase family)
MEELRGRVAVVTGAASGIGRALALRCAQEGMSVVLADIEEPALARCAEDLVALGASVLAVRTDVSRTADVTTLAERTIDHFGSVHLLFNNAGVASPGSIWESSDADWEWVLGVDIWGVIHGVRAFLPTMMAQDVEGYVVNTASGAGLVPRPDMASYTVAKYGVVALSECLHHQLRERHSKIRVSVLCPGAVRTRILDAGRNRPPSLCNETTPAHNPETEVQWQALQEAVQQAIAPEQIADCAFQAIREDRFYALAHPGLKAQVQLRTDDILKGRDPARIPR